MIPSIAFAFSCHQSTGSWFRPSKIRRTHLLRVDQKHLQAWQSRVLHEQLDYNTKSISQTCSRISHPQKWPQKWPTSPDHAPPVSKLCTWHHLYLQRWKPGWTVGFCEVLSENLGRKWIWSEQWISVFLCKSSWLHFFKHHSSCWFFVARCNGGVGSATALANRQHPIALLAHDSLRRSQHSFMRHPSCISVSTVCPKTNFMSQP